MHDNAFSIKEVQYCISNGWVDWSDHALDRLEERNLRRSEILALLHTSEIVETRFDAFPLPKCLLLCYTSKRDPLYAAVGFNKKKGRIVIITVHWQDPERWLSDTVRKPKS